jgi:hypothetical protein
MMTSENSEAGCCGQTATHTRTGRDDGKIRRPSLVFPVRTFVFPAILSGFSGFNIF